MENYGFEAVSYSSQNCQKFLWIKRLRTPLIKLWYSGAYYFLNLAVVYIQLADKTKYHKDLKPTKT